MRCFLFQDFQLAPTLEEFEGIEGIPPKDKGPYVEIGRYPNVEKLAKVLNIDEIEFAKSVKTKGNDKIIEDINKRVSLKEEERLKVRECLRGANSQLEKKNQELHHLKGEWKKSQVNGSELREELEGAKRDLNGMVSKYEEHVWRERLKKEAIERELARNQFELENERENLEEYKKFIDRQGEICETLKRESEAWERRYRNLVDTVESGTLFRILRRDGAHWEGMFSKLAKLANDVIRDIPAKLEDADMAIHPLNAPPEVFSFIEFCKTMMRNFEEKIKEAEKIKAA
ncbi:hypothetical protein TSUD_148520 [Trifolium subterraneum]|uniref:DUF7745 domain-containing protein n=1 Tax=Trifolium subterraneum TaxID=3900 RepID=A0A2Z6MQQ0_TRISU|nr:hypothetical protein TSUD_148520 [Trifolium subterraneum]